MRCSQGAEFIPFGDNDNGIGNINNDNNNTNNNTINTTKTINSLTISSNHSYFILTLVLASMSAPASSRIWTVFPELLSAPQ